MSSLNTLKSLLDEVADRYRIIYSKVYKLEYLKLYGESNNRFIEEEKYQVYGIKNGIETYISSSDIEYIVKLINDNIFQSDNLENYFWHYEFFEKQDPIEYRNNKVLFDEFSFDKYEDWLNGITNKFNSTEQTFQYYAELIYAKVITEKQSIEQYLTSSSMYYFDTKINNFLIQETDIFINDKLALNNLKTDIAPIENLGIEEVTFSPESINTILNEFSMHLLGENVMNYDSIFEKSSLGQKIFQNDISIVMKSSLAFDQEGIPNKDVTLIKNGKLQHFVNDTISSQILFDKRAGNVSWFTGECKKNRDFYLYVSTKNAELDKRVLINNIRSIQSNKLDKKMEIIIYCTLIRNSKDYQVNIKFDFWDFINHLTQNENTYFYKEGKNNEENKS